jgi:hypothetical protein
MTDTTLSPSQPYSLGIPLEAFIDFREKDSPQAFLQELKALDKKELIELLWLSMTYRHDYSHLHTAEKARATLKRYGFSIPLT